MNHLVRGLRILGERWSAGPRAWVAAGDNWLDKAVRAGMLGGAGLVVFRVLSVSLPVLGVSVLVVCVLALRAATKAAKGETKAAPAKADPAPAAVADGDPDTGLPAVSVDDFVALIRDVLGTAPAVHLATLATVLVHRVGGPWESGDVRALCRAHAVPVRPKVRDLGGERVSSGLHRDDLPLPRPLPEGAQEGPVGTYTAGQSGNATELRKAPRYAPTPTETRHGELRIVATDDPDNPARTHVTVIDPARRKRA